MMWFLHFSLFVFFGLSTPPLVKDAVAGRAVTIVCLFVFLFWQKIAFLLVKSTLCSVGCLFVCHHANVAFTPCHVFAYNCSNTRTSALKKLDFS